MLRVRRRSPWSVLPQLLSENTEVMSSKIFVYHIGLYSNNNPYASFGATQAWDEEKNLWSAPHDISHTEADDDRILYNLIVVRDKLDKDSEEWQKLNYDIYTLRQMRREVRSRWKHILEDLGFQKEADTLLSVTKRSIISDSQNMSKAREILLKLSEETTIFPRSWELSERYLFVVDRLIALDAADEFFRIASITYPKRICSVKEEDNQKMAQCNSALS
ncbi:melanoregulin isoform X1 [Varanus komodoensis]|uniref:melanoregulin isoform X1 n=1 Tax=Varanus komodoensis TaxID=61221 RepID=UPI001CF7D9D0|nr:melanoregulin isoform X1 [Varanus komodoensis]XP_044287636.1 melanoregulin isoform X1 [Varanus komodoensis]XP_044287637.1 melanoregulin isoform X1 [Varanus komodoensis]XP_044287638.1 melanoregulin isoform X1 [Varanus komodoensis]